MKSFWFSFSFRLQSYALMMLFAAATLMSYGSAAASRSSRGPKKNPARIQTPAGPIPESCLSLLNQFAIDQTEGGSLQVGPYSKLALLLEKAGAAPKKIPELRRGILLIRSTPPDASHLNSAKVALDDLEKDPKFYICVAHGGCNLKNFPTLVHGYFELNPNYTRYWVDAHGNGHVDGPQPRARRAGERALDHDMHILVMDVQKGKTQVWLEWTAEFFHELTHPAIVREMSDWIEANEALSAAGRTEEMDPNYTAFVTIRDGSVFIDDNFWLVVNEGAASQAHLAAAKIGYAGMPPADLEIENRRNLVSQIFSQSKNPQELRHWQFEIDGKTQTGITPGNIYELTNSLEAQMQKTIARARSNPQAGSQ